LAVTVRYHHLSWLRSENLRRKSHHQRFQPRGREAERWTKQNSITCRKRKVAGWL